VAPTASALPPAPPPRLPPPEESFWQAIEPELRDPSVPVRPIDLPLGEGALGDPAPAPGLYAQLPMAVQDALRIDGFAVRPASEVRTLGSAYVEARERRTPYVITFDTLFFLSQLAVRRVLAEVQALVVIPAMTRITSYLAERLDALEPTASADLSAAMREAREVLAVGQELADPTYVPPVSVRQIVSLEVSKVRAGEFATSSVVLLPIDYTRFDPTARQGEVAALTWYSLAGFPMVSRADRPDVPLDVAQARTATRAAMIISALLAAPEAKDVAALYDGVERLGRFLTGPADDLTPRGLARVAEAQGISLTDRAQIANVAVVDRLRRAVAQTRAPRVADAPAVAPGSPVPMVRLFPARWSADTAFVQSHMSSATPSATPALELVEWLGATGAARLVPELSPLGERRRRTHAEGSPGDDPERHRSVYASYVDTIERYLAASTGEALQAYARSPHWARSKVESALAAWTMLQQSYRTHPRPLPKALGQPLLNPTRTLQTPGFVEAHPEALGRLLATTKQLRRGVTKLAVLLPSGAPVVLEEVEGILAVAYDVSARVASDYPASYDAVVAELVARIAALEARLEPAESSAAGQVSVHASLGVTVPGGRAKRQWIHETVAPEELLMVMREPGAPKPVLAVGLRIPHRDWVQDSAKPAPAPARAPYARAYRPEEQAP
jgi:hypothetical protein